MVAMYCSFQEHLGTRYYSDSAGKGSLAADTTVEIINQRCPPREAMEISIVAASTRGIIIASNSYLHEF
jgi:hypothetical protein